MKTINRILAAAIAAAGLAGRRAAGVREADGRRGRAPRRRPHADGRGEGRQQGRHHSGLDRRAVRAAGGLDAGQGLRRSVPERQGRSSPSPRRTPTQYKDKLTPGTLAMLNKYDNFKMPVYETRRTACYPQSVYDEVKSMATKIELQGFGITGGRSYVPFPIPKNGLEAIWNHQQRYLGGGVDRDYNSFPVRGNGDFYKVGAHEYRIFNANLDQPQDNLLLAFLSSFTAPATLEGTVFLVHEPLDQVKQTRSAWIYNAGQRRVRRAPDLVVRQRQRRHGRHAHVTDQFDAWNGAPDRYDWKLVGKKEIYIPYNAYKLANKALKYDKDIIRKNTPNSDLMRYELHRVWEVEGTLKAGSKHIYGKRVFYLDEDTWTVVYEDCVRHAQAAVARRRSTR